MTESSEDMAIFAAAAIGYQIMFDDDDSDDEKIGERREIVKIDNYAEVIVPAMPDDIFKSHFQMKRSTYQSLCEQLRLIIVTNESGMYTLLHS